MVNRLVWLWRALPLLAIAFFCWWEFSHLGPFQYNTAYYPFDDADDWRYTACSSLVARGYPLFTQVFSAQPPLLFESLAGGMQVWGTTLRGAQITEVLFGLLSLVSVAGISWLLADDLAAAIATLVLAISPGFLAYSHTVDAEGPMMALGATALLLAVVYLKFGHRTALLVSGLVVAAAILTKLFAVEVAGPILLIVWLRHRDIRSALPDATLFAGAAAIPVVLEFILVAPRQQWDQVVRMHDVAAGINLPNVISTPDLFLRFVRLDPGLAVLALAGLLLLTLYRRWPDLSVIALWLLGTMAMLAIFHPLFPHHLAILLAPLAVAAGVGISVGVRLWCTRLSVGTVLVVVAGAVYLIGLIYLVRADRHLLLPGPRAGVASLAAYVQSHVPSGRMVAADDLAVADLSGRLVPPPLCDPSNVRLRSGYLTAQDLEKATIRYHPQLVVSSFDLFPQIPEYMHWLASHYHRVPGPAGAQIYASPVSATRR